ncbi:hypothetical protein H5V45_07720 [Nocardioides sp. KIGAM211]|uniref:Endonuclease/exonuclease/phosphatase domain-containing protein n=1 Tax=Nocardioides luti TaxID=2761101 RepID=A0A7X0VBI4_9ACTN|nr:hypothetical protein [Nocardioides luti]MBB6627208.1 hypothetical protein [Nocardioides luti]
MRLITRPLVATLLATLACGGLAVASETSAQAAPSRAGAAAGAGAKDDPAPVERIIRIGTYNVRAGVSIPDFNAASDAFKAVALPDIAGFQEIGQIPKRTHLASDRSWGVFAAEEMEQNPVIWRRADFDLVRGSGFKLADGMVIDDEKGVTPEVRKPSYATVVRLVDRATGQKLSVINVHLVPGAVKAGHPTPGRPKLFKLYTKQVAGAVRAVKAESAVSDRVFIFGDFNVGYKADLRERRKALPYRQFKAIGYTSMWQGSPYLTKKYGTHQDALIDQVYTVGGAANTEIFRTVKQSDHFPAVATYTLGTPPVGYTPTVGSVAFKDLALTHHQRWENGDRPRMYFTLTQSLPLVGNTNVQVVPGGTAELGKDFTVDDSQLWDSDLTTNDVVVTLTIDKRKENPEDDETFQLQLVNALNTVPVAGQDVATGTILSNK